MKAGGARASGRFATTLVALLSIARAAQASDAPGVSVRTWQPSIDPRANLVLEPVVTPGPWSFSAGAWGHFEDAPVVFRSPSGQIDDRPVASVLGLDLVASLGLGSSSEVGLRLPTFLDENGSSGQPAPVISSGRVPRAGFGDLAVDWKQRILSGAPGGLGLAAVAEATLPTGATESFMGERGATLGARALADVALVFANLQASLGYIERTSHVVWPAGPTGVAFGDALPWSLGILAHPGKVPLLDPEARQAWELALHGSLPVDPVGPFDRRAAPLSPVLLAISNRVDLGHDRDAFLVAGVDVGLDHAIGVPAILATLAVGYRFEDRDEDGDGVEGDRDACPHLAEDRDGYEDADGCPEVDNDDDGVVDAEDACPNVPGAPSVDPRQNGCPAPTTMPSSLSPQVKSPNAVLR